MKIQFRQTGGFAGLGKAVAIDTARMPPNEAEVLKLTIEQSSFFDVSAPPASAMPDREQSAIAIESEGRSRQIQLGTARSQYNLK